MKRIARTCVLVCIALIAPSSETKAQTTNDSRDKQPSTVGFANTVSDLLANMQGEWTIKSATLMGAELPLDQFDQLTVDDKGFTLNVQKREKRFAFAEFELESKRFLAKCSSSDYPKGLTYEIRLSDRLIQIRYRVNGADVAPDAKAKDHELLVQTWTKSKAK